MGTTSTSITTTSITSSTTTTTVTTTTITGITTTTTTDTRTDITTTTVIMYHNVKEAAIATDWISHVVLRIIFTGVVVLLIITLAAMGYLFIYKTTTVKRI